MGASPHRRAPASPHLALGGYQARPAHRPARPFDARHSPPTSGQLARAVWYWDCWPLGRGVSEHTLLDRLIRGRIWIALIAFALIGIVTLQLLVLQLNASIGRALVREAQLQRGNAAYSIENSELASGERVESQAARLGMQLVPVGALRFLTSDPRV